MKLIRPRIIASAVALIGIAALGYALQARAGDPALPEACLSTSSEPEAPAAGMVWIEGGRFTMGSEAFRREEAPLRKSAAEGFWVDSHDVTNAQFARFVEETGYLTLAERLNASGSAQAGSFVFVAPQEAADLADSHQWWRFVPGANWRHPEGPQSTIAHRMNHPVVQVAYADAEAYARWAGHSLPTEAQWEFAARGGLDGATYSWGNLDEAEGAPLANHWRGVFPVLNLGSKGFKGTSPVGCFPANPYGLYDMAGNVWQWTQDVWRGRDISGSVSGPLRTAGQFHVIKGGSYLCAANYCMRYRPAARQPGDVSAGASHIGFRTVLAPASDTRPMLPRRAAIEGK